MIKSKAKLAKNNSVKNNTEPSPQFPGQELVSPFSNNFYVIVGATFTRLVFGHRISTEEPTPHSAITMPTSDVEEMARRILGLIGEIEKSSKSEEADTGRRPS